MIKTDFYLAFLIVSTLFGRPPQMEGNVFTVTTPKTGVKEKL